MKADPMRKIRTIAVLPTLFTLGNLICGFFAIVVASRVAAPESLDPLTTQRIGITAPSQLAFDKSDPTHNIMLSGWLIFLAMVFDALDGHVARLSRTSSDFGAELDSLCDVVTFGVAPGFLLVKMVPEFAYLHPGAIWIIAAVFPACAAMRLARFNVETADDDDHMHFSGLPSPAAAGSIAGFAILFYTTRIESQNPGKEWLADVDRAVQHGLPFFAVAVAALMVSRIPYPHVVNQVFRGQRSFGHLVGLVFALLAVMLIRGYAVPILCVLFVFGPPFKFLWRRAHQRSAENEPIF
jgi:CDP-diacylglycerol--serine O-phosphatidyltransferase